MSIISKRKAVYHLPGLFEFYEMYRLILPLYRNHREYFYDWCEIGSIYGAPADALFGGGRTGFGEAEADEVLSLMEDYGISARLTFSNSLLREEHLHDRRCNSLLKKFNNSAVENGVIVHSELLTEYIKEKYPELYLVSSTTKVLTEFSAFLKETDRDDMSYVVPDFRLNRRFSELSEMSQQEKDKTEFLCNECCYFYCQDRKRCYEAVSAKNIGTDVEHICRAPESEGGYRFSKAMKNPSFIGVSDITEIYLPMGFSNFKIEGRGLGSALVLEFILYYMIKPEYQINVREEVYLDNMLDLF